MKSLWIGTAIAGAAALAAATPNPADPAVAIPAVQYRSVFVDTPKGIEKETADWRKANAEVGQLRRGHVDILKWEAEQERLKRASRAVPAPTGRGSQP